MNLTALRMTASRDEALIPDPAIGPDAETVPPGVVGLENPPLPTVNPRSRPFVEFVREWVSIG